MIKYHLVLAGLLGFIIAMGCAPKHDPLLDLSSEDSCITGLQEVFEQYYHPILTSNCTACHSGNLSYPAHSSDDVDVAFNAFYTSGESAIYSNGTSDGHGLGGYSSLTSSFDDARTQWNAARVVYDSCSAE